MMRIDTILIKACLNLFFYHGEIHDNNMKFSKSNFDFNSDISKNVLMLIAQTCLMLSRFLSRF